MQQADIWKALAAEPVRMGETDQAYRRVNRGPLRRMSRKAGATHLTFVFLTPTCGLLCSWWMDELINKEKDGWSS